MKTLKSGMPAIYKSTEKKLRIKELKTKLVDRKEATLTRISVMQTPVKEIIAVRQKPLKGKKASKLNNLIDKSEL